MCGFDLLPLAKPNSTCVCPECGDANPLDAQGQDRRYPAMSDRLATTRLAMLHIWGPLIVTPVLCVAAGILQSVPSLAETDAVLPRWLFGGLVLCMLWAVVAPQVALRRLARVHVPPYQRRRWLANQSARQVAVLLLACVLAGPLTFVAVLLVALGGALGHG